jgi:hypothetical protein
MNLTDYAGWGGIGFVVLALASNALSIRAGLPIPASGQSLDAVADAFARGAAALKRASVVAPTLWLCTTLFAAGLLSVLWPGNSESGGWALVGFAGVLMQNASFMCVEALRFGIASAASQGRSSIAGLWGCCNVLFGFNQVFLALALLGFTAAGANAGFIPGWQVWLGYTSAALLFLSASLSPYNAAGRTRLALVGLIGWLGWVGWIVVYSIILLRL